MKTFENIASLKLATLKEGQFVETGGYYSKGDGGGARYLIATPQAADEFGDHTLANGNVAVLQRSYPQDVRQYGARGDLVADDTAAIQSCMDANLSVLFPIPVITYSAEGLTPNRGQTLIGESQYDGGAGTTTHINGLGGNHVFLCGDGGTTQLREITFDGLNINGNTFSAIYGRTSQNLKVRNCYMATTHATNSTVDLELCARAQFHHNRISCSGGGWAVRAMDNVNGSQFSHNIITGGSIGGAFKMGMCASSEINNNIIETSLNGIWISSTTETGTGNCDAIILNNNYIEDCATPFAIGKENFVSGLTGSANYVGNSNLTFTPVAIVQWGRVKNCKFTNNRYAPHTTEDVYHLFLDQGTGDQEANELGNDLVTGTPLNVYALTGSQAASGSVQRIIGWQNYYPFLNDLSRPDTVVFESGILSAATGQSTFAFNDFNPLVLGGKVTKVEVFEKTGTVTSTLTVGRNGDGAEIANVDPETLSYVNGRADVTLLTANATLRATESAVYRVVAGAGTGSFRVRITYRVS